MDPDAVIRYKLPHSATGDLARIVLGSPAPHDCLRHSQCDDPRPTAPEIENLAFFLAGNDINEEICNDYADRIRGCILKKGGFFLEISGINGYAAFQLNPGCFATESTGV